MLCILALIAVVSRHKVPDQERIFIKAVVLALPFILIHIVYSLCAAFSNTSTFNPVTGSTTASLCMSVLEEMAVVVTYVYAGLQTRSTPLPEDASAPRQLGYRLDRGDFGTGRLGLLSLALGVFNAFRGGETEKEEVQEQRSQAGTEAHSVSIATIAEVHAATRGRLGQERGVRIRDISRLWCEAYHKLASI
ncbi:hypothetical protein LTR09_001189 [Extremus antarcticus]|uniref:DUF7702 domain-containing protein n=1 Tax=Extremus antarcticus TaxID=702011 RepID=A0AAJ0GIC2_9PEZI|nr:hypothetical protein LTR09_001189 [Extremus antarcticus]